MIATKTLFHAVIALISLDVIITTIAVTGIGATELNPLVDIFGFVGFMVVKIIISLIAISFIYKYCIPFAPATSRYGLTTLVIVYSAVFTSNMYKIMGYVI